MKKKHWRKKKSKIYKAKKKCTPPNREFNDLKTVPGVCMWLCLRVRLCVLHVYDLVLNGFEWFESSCYNGFVRKNELGYRALGKLQITIFGWCLLYKILDHFCANPITSHSKCKHQQVWNHLPKWTVIYVWTRPKNQPTKKNA